MSTTSYQTKAKPRGRAGSCGEGSENQTSSRASSSASLRLSKTLSRALDEVSVPRNSRPGSPVVYVRRSKTHDPGRLESVMTSPRHSTSSMRPSRTTKTIIDDGQSPRNDGPSKEKPVIIAQPEDQKHSGLPEDLQSAAGVRSGNPTPAPLSLRSPSSMQPTVIEEGDETLAAEPIPLSPQKSVPSIAEIPDVGQSPATTEFAPRNAATLLSHAGVESSSPPQPNPTSTARLSEEAHRDSLVAPSPQAPVPFIHPTLVHSLPGVSEAEVPIHVDPDPVRETEGNEYYQGLPNTSSPLTLPPHSPIFHQHLGRPASQPAPYPYPYPHPVINNSPGQHPFYPAPFPFPIAPFSLPETVFSPGLGNAEDERTKLLEKVSNVLPDINRLLHYYQETQGLLNQKDHLVKQNATQHEEAIHKIKIELSVTKEEYERIIGEQASENLRLKSNIKEQAEKISGLEVISREASGTKEQLADLQAKHQLLQQQMEQVKTLNEESVSQRRAMEADLESLKEQARAKEAEHDRAMTELKTAHKTTLAETEEIHARLSIDQKSSLSKTQLDLAGMITKHTQQKRDLESARSTISQQEDSLARKSKQLADALELHKNQLDAANKAGEDRADEHKKEVSSLSEKLASSIARHEAESEALRASRQKEIDQLRKAADEEHQKLVESFELREKDLQTELNASQNSLRTLQGELDAKHDGHRRLESELAAERKAHNNLKIRHETATSHHLELARSMLALRSKQADWAREAERMDRILQSLGQVGSKSKGDTDQFFIKAFDQLALLVEGLSKEYCGISSVCSTTSQEQCKDVDQPDATGDTGAAQGLRCLFAESLVWEVLHKVVFQPFMFDSTGDSTTDCASSTCLRKISRMITRKSMRREAIWRAITMHAIYASDYGRKAAITTATLASREIMHKMQRLTAPEVHANLLQAVRVIVKTAVSIWRQARLELDPVQSSLSGKEDGRVDRTGRWL
ncbi:hypothetical protein LTS07_010423 [Exophiala sideris]|uniref:Pericentrin/AKAP-450 centrosomal targeting domain-containing protein n=1 Tax=Exophiala sideris TaxID=1016849 RepID=A0ABR0IX68_9EURO|nr:hypothetical protein LTS07_010423 [Exophiala sideris]KAK5026323.1 hypothetical protein LTR13_010105 [Exophiala sideris]KAK5051113.1 hypothetical protein LTR69_010490 [Exophiala sideris]KAK5177243.1 hypothetical protein LTR44_010204 [Eurotiomycetes sp. CCFEE 6388]